MRGRMSFMWDSTSAAVLPRSTKPTCCFLHAPAMVHAGAAFSKDVRPGEGYHPRS